MTRLAALQTRRGQTSTLLCHTHIYLGCGYLSTTTEAAREASHSSILGFNLYLPTQIMTFGPLRFLLRHPSLHQPLSYHRCRPSNPSRARNLSMSLRMLQEGFPNTASRKNIPESMTAPSSTPEEIKETPSQESSSSPSPPPSLPEESQLILDGGAATEGVERQVKDVAAIQERLKAQLQSNVSLLRRKVSSFSETAFTRLGQAGGKLNEVTGYREIEALKRNVVERGTWVSAICTVL